MGQTLWERWTRRKKDQMKLAYNPLGLTPGAFVTLDVLGRRGQPPAKLVGLSVYERKPDLRFTDYRFADGGRLRVIPGDAGDQEKGTEFRCYLLAVDAVEPWSAELEGAASHHSGVFNVHQGDTVVAYERVNGLKTRHVATVKEFDDRDGDRVVDETEVQERRVEYWDFWRPEQDEAGQPVWKFLFVEKCLADGQFTLLLGEELDPNRVVC